MFTFPIQVLKFSIASLEIANILCFLITCVEEISIRYAHKVIKFYFKFKFSAGIF